MFEDSHHFEPKSARSDAQSSLVFTQAEIHAGCYLRCGWGLRRPRGSRRGEAAADARLQGLNSHFWNVQLRQVTQPGIKCQRADPGIYDFCSFPELRHSNRQLFPSESWPCRHLKWSPWITMVKVKFGMSMNKTAAWVVVKLRLGRPDSIF